MPAQNRIQGFGSSNASEGHGRAGGRGAYDGLGGADDGDDGGDSFSTASTGLGSKKMEGFGNPRYAASSGYRPAARGSNTGGMAAAAWEGAMSGASTALAGAGTALQGASSAFSNGPLSGATTVLTGAGNALSNAGNALTGALSPKASAAARRTREARPMLDAVRYMPSCDVIQVQSETVMISFTRCSWISPSGCTCRRQRQAYHVPAEPMHRPPMQGSGGYDSDGAGHSSNSSFRGPGAADAGRPLSFSRPPATDGSEEAELVDALCTPGGLRAAPEREDLRLFVESISAVNGTTVADLLRQKMVSLHNALGLCWLQFPSSHARWLLSAGWYHLGSSGVGRASKQ